MDNIMKNLAPHLSNRLLAVCASFLQEMLICQAIAYVTGDSAQWMESDGLLDGWTIWLAPNRSWAQLGTTTGQWWWRLPLRLSLTSP